MTPPHFSTAVYTTAARALLHDTGGRVTGLLNQTELTAFLTVAPSPELLNARSQRKQEEFTRKLRALDDHRNITDLRYNDGVRAVYDATRVAQADLFALGGELEDSLDLPAPFSGWRYTWRTVEGGAHFSISTGKRQHLTGVLCLDDAPAAEIWPQKCANAENTLFAPSSLALYDVCMGLTSLEP